MAGRNTGIDYFDWGSNAELFKSSLASSHVLESLLCSFFLLNIVMCSCSYLRCLRFCSVLSHAIFLSHLYNLVHCTGVHLQKGSVFLYFLAKAHRSCDIPIGTSTNARKHHVSLSNAHSVVCFVLLLPSVGPIKECLTDLLWYPSLAENAKMDASGSDGRHWPWLFVLLLPSVGSIRECSMGLPW